MSVLSGRLLSPLSVVFLCAAVAPLSHAADSGTVKPVPPAAVPAPAPGPQKKLAVVPSSEQIDINSASRAQLKTLPGIGDADAGKIIAGRPYKTKAELATRNIIPEGVYISIKYRIRVKPYQQPKPKTK
jgi:competence protein ComEA